ncbi:beta-1,4-N-acetylgalactosaminyltransferase 3 [Pygocentrus nattereri]|uniref:Beta-1,4-N-acetylgalactosaminyltransferase n=1 Tax=Pygocentrus nattereri TaxID=42514 RepID=A0A3B4DDK1_PYGNA|nr:beta-1,4-N-acetylgalactosaminyltransferase 3 [Pygocentrus nattereri]
MKYFLSELSGFFSYRKLKNYVVILVLSVLIFVIYLAFHGNYMERKDFIKNVPRESHQQQPIDDEFIKQEFEEPDNESLPPWRPEHKGGVNMHVFEDWCATSILQLRKNVLYPLYPHVRTTIKTLAIYPKSTNYGVRIFGYIHPNVSGEYIFAISSDKNSEFWLSSNESTKGLRLQAYVGKTGMEWAGPGEYGKFASQISKPVKLLKHKQYFFEVLLQHNEGVDHVEVAWRLNQRNSIFTVITSEYLSLYVNETSVLAGDTDNIPQTVASHEMHPDLIYIQRDPVVDMAREDLRDYIFQIPLMNDSYLKNIFPQCNYKPINVFDGAQMQRFHGIYYVHYSRVYPNDHTRQAHSAVDEMCFYNQDKVFKEGGGFVQYLKTVDGGEKSDLNWERSINVNPTDFNLNQPTVVIHTCKRVGNAILSEEDVMPVVDAVMNKLQLTEHTSELVLKRIVNVEKRVDGDAGGRYLLELELEDAKGQNMLLSRYFHVTTNKEGSPELPEPISFCSPEDFSWNPAARVHVILPVKKQGRWVIQFIRQMEKVYRVTKDENFNVIIIDYSSDDVDIHKALKKANLPSFQYRRLEGTFLKTTAVQTAIELIEDENSILFTTDLHLNFPVSIIHMVRKHCVQGKMIFAPAVMRLDCGISAHDPTGFWEIDGYGLIGIYKSDMDRIGGMNTKDFKDKWGGEDWELLDRILENRLEVERLNLRNFLHHHHSKRGMWNN